MTNRPVRDSIHGAAESKLLSQGSQCYLRVLDRRFFCEIMEVGEQSIRVTFPGMDYPVEGTPVDLEFHVSDGYTCYHTQVVSGPAASGGGLVLERAPGGLKFYRHRDSWRVPTDFLVQLKFDGEPRRHNLPLLNISAGGIMVRTDLPLEFGSSVLLTLELPGEPAVSTRGRVVHIQEAPGGLSGRARLVGIKFQNVEANARRAVTRYVWKRIRELFPEQLKELYPRGRDAFVNR